LASIGQQLHPAHAQIFARYPVSYYWATYPSEWDASQAEKKFAVSKYTSGDAIRENASATAHTVAVLANEST
jgi:hypothetical protein